MLSVHPCPQECGFSLQDKDQQEAWTCQESIDGTQSLCILLQALVRRGTLLFLSQMTKRLWSLVTGPTTWSLLKGQPSSRRTPPRVLASSNLVWPLTIMTMTSLTLVWTCMVYWSLNRMPCCWVSMPLLMLVSQEDTHFFSFYCHVVKKLEVEWPSSPPAQKSSQSAGIPPEITTTCPCILFLWSYNLELPQISFLVRPAVQCSSWAKG